MSIFPTRLWNRLKKNNDGPFSSGSGATASEPGVPTRSAARGPGSSPLPFCFAVAAAGVFCDACFAPPPFLWGGFFLLAAGHFVLFRSPMFGRVKPSDRDLLASVALGGVIFSCFGLWHQVRWSFFPKDEIGFLVPAEHVSAVIEGVIRSTPVFYENAFYAEGGVTSTEVETVRIRNRGEWTDCSGKVTVQGNGDLTAFRIGDPVRVTGKLAHIVGPANPGENDWAFRARARRILLRMTNASFRPTERLDAMPRYTILRAVEKIRRAASELFTSRLSPENGALASAIVLGMRNAPDDETLDMFRHTGTVHLISVSGLHVSLVALFLFLVIRAMAIPHDVKAVVLSAAILGYVLLAGAQPPAIRAAVLFWVLCLSMLVRRKTVLINSFAASALILLLLNPANLFLTGVHLSFLATGVFLWLLPERSPASPKKEFPLIRQIRNRIHMIGLQYRDRPMRGMFLRFAEKLGEGFLRVMVASFLIELILLPAILTNIHLCTPVSFLVNPIIWLPFEAALILALAMLLFGWVPLLGGILAHLTDGTFSLLTLLLDASRQIPFAWFRIPGPSLWWSGGFYLPFVFWTLFPKYRPRLKTIFLFVGLWLALGIGVSGISRYQTYRRGRVDIEILSVGHGGANLIFYPGKTALFDCGTMGDGVRAGRVTESALFARGRMTIDLLLLSHADTDHCNGVPELLRSIRVRHVAVPSNFFSEGGSGSAPLREALEERKIPIEYVGAGDDLSRFGFPELEILHPEKGTTEKNTNASSLVLCLTHLGRRVLLTGDLDTQTPPEFPDPSAAPYDLITIPHHGGVSQATGPLLKELSPNYAVVSEIAGRLSPETERKWREEFPDLRILNTGTSGAIRARIEKKKSGKDSASVFTLRPTRYPAMRNPGVPEPETPNPDLSYTF